MPNEPGLGGVPPSRGSQRAVFLSYASEDAVAAQRICETLRAAGIEVWFDQSELRGGDAWDRKIRHEIRDCALFIPVISRNTQARTEGYFRLEWRLADQRTHLMAKSRAYLVPVCIDETRDADAEVPDSFSAVHWTRLPAGATPPKFAEWVARLLAPEDHSTLTPVWAVAGGTAAATIHPAPSDPTAVAEKSIAVLPFANLSADKDNEYFSDGLAEDILIALSEVDDLLVAARMSSFSFKGKAVEMSEIAAKLRVANVLDGSVRRAGNRIRVTVQLVDARNGFQLWSERYDRQIEDIFEIQDDIARAITARLKVALGAGARRATTNLEAYELYLKGRHYWYQRSSAALRAAIQCFEQAIKLDPNYAIAYAGLADCYPVVRFYGYMSADAARPPAQAAMTQAIELAPTLWESNFSRGLYTFYFEPAWRDAEAHFKKAASINPRCSIAQGYCGLLLMTEGRAAEAVAQTALACELDPLAPIVHCFDSQALRMAGRCAESERAATRALELQPDWPLSLWMRGLALCCLGRNSDAVELMERAAVVSRSALAVGHLGFAYARAGRRNDAVRLLDELEDCAGRGEYVTSLAPLITCVGLGELPALRQSLMTAIAEPVPPFAVRVSCGNFLEAFRTDPEIDRLHIQLFGW